MAQDTTDAASSSETPADETGTVVRSSGAIDDSVTRRVVRITAVVGTLLILGVVTVYLVLGAGGFLSPYEGSAWGLVGASARISFLPVLVSYLFLYHRPQLENFLGKLLRIPRKKDTYPQHMIVIVFLAGAAAGGALAYALKDVDYSPSAELRSALNHAVTNAILAVSATTPEQTGESARELAQAALTTAVNNIATAAAAAIDAVVNASDAPGVKSAVASAIQSTFESEREKLAAAAVSATANAGSTPEVRSAVASAIRSASTSPTRSVAGTSTSTNVDCAARVAATPPIAAATPEDFPDECVALNAAVNDIVAAAFDAAVNAGVNANEAQDLRSKIKKMVSKDIIDALNNAPGVTDSKTASWRRFTAEIVLSVCLAFVLFAPRELSKLLERATSEPTGPALAGYFGLLSGMLAYLAFLAGA